MSVVRDQKWMNWYRADERIVEVESDLDKTALDTCPHHIQGVVLISVLVIASGGVFIL